MVGARLPEDGGGYPVSEVAARHGASVAVSTPLPSEAYRGLDHGAQARLDLS